MLQNVNDVFNINLPKKTCNVKIGGEGSLQYNYVHASSGEKVGTENR